MSEILFRGKRIDNGEWVYSQTVFSHLDNFYIPAQNLKCTVMRNLDTVGNISEIRCKDGKCFFKVQTETVGQFTGLTDKNGKKIFEGDIVRTHYANAPKAVFVETVIFDCGKFCATSTNEGCKTTATLWDGVPRLAIDKSVYMDEVEVIGNIHDNPELLGGDD